jgi:hypothetical protein
MLSWNIKIVAQRGLSPKRADAFRILGGRLEETVF